MSQANLNNLVSKLRIKIRPVQRQFSNPEGPLGRVKIMRKTVTALVKHERIELNFNRADEARGYAERLISEAIRHGDCHRPTMNLAKFWIEDEAYVPKLFKVLVPRFQEWPSGLPYTRLLRAPSTIKDHEDHEYIRYPKAVLELRGNPYPPLHGPVSKTHPGLIHNVLLEEARKDYFRSQTKLAQQAETEVQATFTSVRFSLPDEDTCHLEPVSPEDISTLADGLNEPISHDRNPQKTR